MLATPFGSTSETRLLMLRFAWSVIASMSSDCQVVKRVYIAGLEN